MRKPMYKSKAWWTGVLTAGVAFATTLGVPVPEGTLSAMLAVMGIFIRMGVEQNKDPVSGKIQ